MLCSFGSKFWPIAEFLAGLLYIVCAAGRRDTGANSSCSSSSGCLLALSFSLCYFRLFHGFLLYKKTQAMEGLENKSCPILLPRSYMFIPRFLVVYCFFSPSLTHSPAPLLSICHSQAVRPSLCPSSCLYMSVHSSICLSVCLSVISL